ncbi:unnamed protein product [Sphenostylis stenocarpa]|uniref:SHSP domain-containing protein n=1 Tax=Sphenostylis stenocarpa TaxID=92480 RepID=A0AA86SKP6_9FABA|nr:unnamed protein product [Sphenostylis stenocarpa]
MGVIALSSSPSSLHRCVLLSKFTSSPSGPCDCESTTLLDLRENFTCTRMSVPVKQAVVSDRKFLIDFFFTTYLGPDVMSHNPTCCVTQRLVFGFPPYVLSDLRPSYISISLLERLYYFLLRFSPPHVVLDLNMLRAYLKGNLFLPSLDFVPGSKQFISFFPLDLHQQIWYPDTFRIMKGIVLIDDPSPSCIREDDFNRFKSLTGMTTLKLNLGEFFQLGCRSSDEGDGHCMIKWPEAIHNKGCESGEFKEDHKRKRVEEILPLPEIPHVIPTKHNLKIKLSKKRDKSVKPKFMPLFTIPEMDDCIQDSPVIITGSALKGQFGSSVGIVDIGSSEVAYLFRVSIPGVTKNEGNISCDIEANGNVQIRGMVTGGRTLIKESRVFEMKFRELGSGPFTLSFSLPGPVDPRLFLAKFKPEGILEGVVIKQ